MDEIGEIPLELQSKLLRVIQEGEYERVGENKTHKVAETGLLQGSGFKNIQDGAHFFLAFFLLNGNKNGNKRP